MLGAPAFCNFVAICSCCEPFWYYLSIYSMGYSKFDASAMDWNLGFRESGKIVLSLRAPSHNDKWPGFDVETLQSLMSFLNLFNIDSIHTAKFCTSCIEIISYIPICGVEWRQCCVCPLHFVICCDLLLLRLFSHYLFYRFF